MMAFTIIYFNILLSFVYGESTTTEFDANYYNLSTDEYTHTTITSNFTLETTNCDMNTSCTDTSAFTTPIPMNNSRKLMEKSKIFQKNIFTSQDNICTCDLIEKYCDINCCCDKDCTLNQKKLFTHCIQDKNIYYDTRYCNFIKYIYINNTQFEWKVNQNNLFCILKSNMPKSYVLQRKHPLESVQEGESMLKSKYRWFIDKDYKGEEDFFNEHFIYGENIWLIENNHIKKFELPNSFLSDDCIVKEPIRNLVNRQNFCYQTDISEENHMLNLAYYLKNIYFIASPKLFNFSLYKNNIQNCSKNVCLPIEFKLCDKNLNICVKPKNTSYFLNVQCSYSITTNINTCINVVKSIKYIFYHNGTEGFKNVELHTSLESVSYKFNNKESYRFIQDFSINFKWLKETINVSNFRSGNPGYLIGKPILIAQRNNTTIFRNSTKFTSNFLVLPENINNICTMNDNYYKIVEFGYSMKMNCLFQTKIYTKNLNGTIICHELQNNLLKLWSIIHPNQCFGMFGNANEKNVNDWHDILMIKNSTQLLNDTFGKFSNFNKTLNCFNIISKLFIDIYYVRVDYENLLNQNKILGVTIRYDGYKNVSLSFNKNLTKYTDIISSHVMFHDVTSEKLKKFVDAPTFKIRLPHDFFYPFIKVDNNVNSFSCEYLQKLLRM